MRARSLVLALLSGALALGALAVPAAAAGTTRWVDDDGKAGPGSCRGSASAAKSIQAGVNQADAGDTVRVCPGDYTGKVVVGPSKDGITIISDRPWRARLHAPESLTGAGSTLLKIGAGANHVTLQWLVLLKEGSAATPSGSSDCGLANGIWVRGQHAVIQSVRIRVTGTTYSPCGLERGILVGDGLSSLPAGAAAPASATVSHGALRDFWGQGILAVGAGVRLDALRNSVRYWHLGATQVPVPCATACVKRPGRAGTRLVQGPAGDNVTPGVGIAIALGARGTIVGNEVSSGPDARILRVGGAGQQTGTTPPLQYGIAMERARETQIRANTVRRALFGVWVYLVKENLVKGNVVTDHGYGIAVVDSFRVTVRDNQAGPGVFGIYVSASEVQPVAYAGGDNLIQANTALGNNIDCVDTTAGLGTGTATTLDTWKQNTGITSNPAGLCGQFQ